MNQRDAVALIARAVGSTRGTWADLGAGSGTFTLALASLLDTDSQVLAVERDEHAIAALRDAARHAVHHARILPVRGDFTAPLDLPALDGALLANSLHYIAYEDQATVLTSIIGRLRPQGRVILVEYENRAPNRWVPFPISLARFSELATSVGLAAPTRVGERQSRYGATMYAAFTQVDAAR